ncbi:MAG: YfiR family protein, partial [Bacteroidia bacterium]|nr:YfiR family protein [Bacteroidia bacterium]
KKVGNQDIAVTNTPEFDPKVNANIVYLLPDLSKSIANVNGKAKSKGVLVISETANGAKAGAAINFVVLENKPKFEYSKSNAVKAGLKANDDFKALAINVD